MSLIDFPKTQNITQILGMAPNALRPTISMSQQRGLSRYAVVVRYPAAPDPTLAEARAAVALARRVRAEVRRKLPRAALRRPKASMK